MWRKFLAGPHQQIHGSADAKFKRALCCRDILVSINIQIYFLSSSQLLTTTTLGAVAATEPAAERGIAIPADHVGRTCVANGCKRIISIIPGIYYNNYLLPPIGNRVVITAKLNVDHVYQCCSGGLYRDYKTVSYCIVPETNYASEIRRGVGSIVRRCASAIEE
ncbi:hypothetical protein V499_07878 [Pseudogymnoascus sp. VKM F-103]|nr:hypothetical protein V499_07878 [Pseudogymnoascus sp. VKM F-103]